MDTRDAMEGVTCGGRDGNIFCGGGLDYSMFDEGSRVHVTSRGEREVESREWRAGIAESGVRWNLY